jgi:D-aminoacyl-tRNA deacylase
MRALVQRVTEAAVQVDGEVVGQIGKGFLVLLGVTQSDSRAEADLLAHKVARLRIFEDAEEKMNLALGDVGGGVLLVSQFTLYANARKGLRPSFVAAARPEQASPLVDYFGQQLRAEGVPVQTGVFGAMMQVSLINDGPVTIWLDTDELK